jgi:hypothetical protein
MKHFVLIFYISFLISETLTDNCDEWSQKHIFNSSEFHVSNEVFSFLKLDSTQDLNEQFIQCIDLFKKSKDPILKVFFNENVILDNDLDFWRDFILKDVILIQNVKGFNQKIFKKTDNSTNKKSSLRFGGFIDFVNVNFDFYQNGTRLTEEKCKRENFDRNMLSFFGIMEDIYLDDNVFYSNKICPYVFMNTNLFRLNLFRITNSLIFQNRLEFLDIDEEDTKEDIDLGTNKLRTYQMIIAYEEISLKNVNKHIFKK